MHHTPALHPTGRIHHGASPFRKVRPCPSRSKSTRNLLRPPVIGHALAGPKQSSLERIDVTHDPRTPGVLRESQDVEAVPQILFDGRSIGGSDDLHALTHRAN